MTQPLWLKEKIARGDQRRVSEATYGDLSARNGEFDHTIPRALYAWERETQLINALQMAYRKHSLDDQSIGWSELGDLIATALSEAMGATAFVRWLADVTGDTEV